MIFVASFRRRPGAWKAGDVIVDINGRGIDPENRWGEAAAGQAVALTREGDERRSLTLPTTSDAGDNEPQVR